VERRIVRSGDGTVLSYRDISERRRTEESLRRSEERLRRLAEHAPVGIFETDAEGRLLWASERWSEIVGIPGARAIGAGWLGALHPEDRERVSTAWGRAVRSGAPFDEECRLLAPDGRVAWVAARAIGLTDPAGRVTGLIGTVSDITDAKRAELEEDALRRAAIAIASDIPPRAVVALVAEEVAAVLEATACAVVQFDEREAEAVVVGAWSAGTHGLHAGSRLRLDSASAVARVHRTGETARSEEETAFDHVLPVDSRLAGAALSEVAAPVRMGRSLWGSIAVARIGERFPPDSEERLQRFCELVGLALANADARERLANLALTDYLTGLPNRRSFQERLAAEVGRAQRHGRPLALVVLDVDHFKEINDRFGHQVGDRVLVEFARRLSALARAGEEVARVGGEEFAWILPETDGAGAQVAAERARRRIAAEPFPGVGRVTVSGGLCDLDQASGSTELFRLADVALYWAKGQGRNRIVRYSPEVSEVLSAEERERRLRRAEALSGIRALAQAIDAKDTSTRRHSERVADLCERIALAAGWAPDAAVRLREAALVHDVGKIGVRDQVLSKPGRLTEEELAEVRQHPLLGARMVEGVLEPDQVAWVRHHHERWDGAGYPAGLSGGDIPEGARMMALAEAWDAMTSVRAYAAALSVAEALAELRREAGRQFDPALAQVLCRLVEESAPPAAQELDAAS
jgi:diguanylate cyclase (GGDEF)-like protein/PAS domain S-box-containing protein